MYHFAAYGLDAFSDELMKIAESSVHKYKRRIIGDAGPGEIIGTVGGGLLGGASGLVTQRRTGVPLSTVAGATLGAHAGNYLGRKVDKALAPAKR